MDADSIERHLRLEVRHERRPGSLELRYRLIACRPHRAGAEEFTPVEVRADLDATLLDRLKRLSRHEGWSAGDLALRALGRECACELLPGALATRLRELAELGGVLEVDADLPRVPWEILAISPTDRDEQSARFLGEAFALVRRPPGEQPVRDFPFEHIAIAGGSALPSSAAEAEALAESFGRGRCRRIVDAPTLLSIVATSRADLWHLIGHADSRAIDPGSSAIDVGDGRALEVRVLIEAAAGRFRVTRPLIFVNACSAGRLESGLRGPAGWSTKLLEAGAAAFVGPQWPVRDSAAAEFARLFYAQVLRGVPFGEAAQRARIEFRSQRAGDPAALAYAVFADPAAALAPRAPPAATKSPRPPRGAEPPPAEAERLRRFYGSARCLASDEEPALWYPLDGRRENARFENLVPLAPRFVRAIEELRRRTRRSSSSLSLPQELPARLAPQVLSARSKVLFGTWDVHRAYGCARLASWISRDLLMAPADDSLRFICDALYFGRQDVGERAILDVLERDLAPALDAAFALSTESALLVLQSLAGLLGECGRVDDARALYIAMDGLLARGRRTIGDPALAAAFGRRRAMALTARLRDPEAIERELAEVEARHRSDPNLRIGLLNSRAWAAFDLGDPRRAYEHVDPESRALLRHLTDHDGRIEPAAMTLWNAAELLLNHAVALTRVRPRSWRDLRRQALAVSAGLFTRSGIRPYLWRRGVWIAEETLRDAENDDVPAIPAPRDLSPRLEQILARLARVVLQKVGLLC